MNTPGKARIEGGQRVRDGFDISSKAGGPLVSIITVCFNSEEHLEQTILSVLGQSYENIEYIVVDGGSTDGTLEIIRRYDDGIAYWLSEPDDGIYDAMNKGISLSSGDLIGTINSNDWFVHDAVEKVVGAYIEDDRASVFHGNMYLIFAETGELYKVHRGTAETILRRFEMNHPTCFVRRDVYDTYRFRTEYRVAADYDLMLRLHFAGARFHHIDSPLVYFRIGGASSDYYRPRVEIYRLRHENGIISTPRYLWKRSTLVAKAAWKRLKDAVVMALFKGDREHRVVIRYVQYRDSLLRALGRGRSSDGTGEIRP